MIQLQETIVFVAAFIIIALASKQIGQFFARFKLPLISGFLFAGILVGPFGLNLVRREALDNLRVIDELSLAVIAFAAGSELYLRELHGRFKSIAWISSLNIIIIPVLGGIAVFWLSTYIPFMQAMPLMARVSASVFAGIIMVARSPSSVIAIVNELRAKGEFTQTAIGVTMVIDVAVILLFALGSEMADALLNNIGINLLFVALLVFEMALSLAAGYGLGKLLQAIISTNSNRAIKIIIVLIVGYSVFALSNLLREYTHENAPFEILLEPLLICMIGSFVVTNYSRFRLEFAKIIHDVSPAIYVIFFTLTGASLALDVLAQVWLIAVILFIVRLVGVFIGSFAGGFAAGDPPKQNAVSWMAFVTQAGVGLGLAKEVAVEFPILGEDFATLLIAVIVLSQLVGPPFFKWAIKFMGEARTRAEPAEFDGVRDVVIFGLKPESVQLAKQLEAHDWQVKQVCTSQESLEKLNATGVEASLIPRLTLADLQALDMVHADALVSFLPDAESYRLCELAYENFGTDTMVVKIDDRANAEMFHQLGVMIVEPQTAVVTLLEHFVRAPVGTSMLLGMRDDQEMIDIELANPDLDGMAIRDIRLPLEVLILSVQRDGHALISHGYTKLKQGDILTIVGSSEKLDDVSLRLEA
ncbi:MAG: potassium transporter TrkA [Chloroflexi bacterium]|nr:potassium transporter TrkA [Chloroflexota bacterium]